MNDYTRIFAEGRIGALTTPNRLVMAPMVRNYAETNGAANKRYEAHIRRIAAGGTGTLILEATFVSPEGRGFVRELGLHDDAMIPGLRRLVDAAHAEGALIGPQLYHAGRQTHSRVTGTAPVAPSAIPCPLMQQLPHELDAAEIAVLVERFGAATQRAREAGCDLVEIHAAHGYLLTQFLSPYSNHRTDAFGGSFEGRMRFPLQVLDAVRRAAGPDMAVIVRLSAEEQVEGGLDLASTRRIASAFEAQGADALHVSIGNYASYAEGRMIAPMAVPDGHLLNEAKAIKDVVSIPVIAVGKLRDPRDAESALEGGFADYIALGRTLLADPDWPRKVRMQRASEINHCVSCNQGCISRLFAQEDVWCTVNPRCGREYLWDDAHAVPERRFVVVGGGPAGMAAACVAAELGHHVTLMEREPQLGGQLFAAAASPLRGEWEDLRSYQVAEVERLGVEARTGVAATRDSVLAMRPDVVIVATGSRPMHPRTTAPDQDRLIFARDVMEGRAEVVGDVIVAGGGCAGAQTAEYLRHRGHPVTIVEAQGSLAEDAPLAERALLLRRLRDLGVVIKVGATINRISAGGVSCDHDGETLDLHADTVVVCMGSQSIKDLMGELAGEVAELRVVGDARAPRQVTEAIAEGALAALETGAVQRGR